MRVILTLRTDFEAQFQDSPLNGLWREGRFVVSPMSQAELREVIEAPAAVRVYFFDPPGLVDTLIDRHRTPLVTTATRAVDKVQENGDKRVVVITHHYLQYSYELLVEAQNIFGGPDEPATIMLTVPMGGTLVLDADWNALTLVTYPPAVANDTGAGRDTLTALASLEQKVKSAIERSAVADAAKAGAHGLSTHGLRKDEAGRTQLMRTACNLADHYQALRQIGPRRRLYS